MEEGTTVVSSFAETLATLAGWIPWWAPPALALALVGLGAGAIVGHAYRRQHRRIRWWPLHRRMRMHMWPGPGFAGRWVLARDYGLLRAWQTAKRCRPDLSWRAHLFGPREQVSVYHGRAQGLLFGLLRHKVRSSLDEHTLTLASPQPSSDYAVTQIWEAPGPVVSHTVGDRPLHSSAGYRAQRGRGEVLVFNPCGVGGTFGSTFKWPPITGCRDFRVAVRRAGYMVGAQTDQGLSPEEFWTDTGTMYLASLLHAADLVARDHNELVQDEQWAALLPEPLTMATIPHWTSTPNLLPYDLLRQHPDACPEAIEALLDFFRQTPLETRQRIMSTVARAVRFMADASITDTLIPRHGDVVFDAERFVRSSDALYLISPPSEGRSPVASLMAAFLGELVTARAKALEAHEDQCGPPVTMVLDQVTDSAPVPLGSWTSGTGRGIVLHLFTHSISALTARWGHEAAEEIVDNCALVKVWPTVKGQSRQWLIKKAGRVRLVDREQQTYKDRQGQDKTRTVKHEQWEDVLPEPGRDVPEGRMVALRRTKRPTVITPPQVWKDQRYARYPVENLTLPPVRHWYAPDARPRPQSRAQGHQEADSEAAPALAQDDQHAPEKRSLDSAPPLRGRSSPS